tara:strand:+ start:27534 stop:27893 length:360 start_codon:yes stop_codon:yes gene_type:complete
MPTVAGVQALDVGGVAYNTAETATYNLGGKQRENIVGGGKGSVGYTEKARAAFIEVKIFLNEGQSSKDVTDAKFQEIKLNCADRTVVMNSGTEVGSGDNDASENSLTVRFEGNSARVVS